MPKHLYISTDSMEAEEIIDPYEKKNYDYHDIEPAEGEHLVKRIGFNPMSSVEFEDSVSDRTIEIIAKELVKSGRFVAVESNGKVTKYIPSDIKEKTKLTELIVRNGPRGRHSFKTDYYLMMYSNNPNEIRDFDRF